MDQENTSETTRDCLVAVVNNDLDLHRFSEGHWYRIPERAIGRSLRIEALADTTTLALYQTVSISNGMQSAIELWGEITERVLLSRREILPEEPAHPKANEQYHLLRVGLVERLDRPITAARPRRLTFLRTSRERLLHAGDLNDLVIGTPAEERLWRSLRQQDLDAERKFYMRVQGVVMEVDFALFHNRRALGVLCSDNAVADQEQGEIPEAWQLLRFSPGDLEHDLASCMGEIMERMNAGEE